MLTEYLVIDKNIHYTREERRSVDMVRYSLVSDCYKAKIPLRLTDVSQVPRQTKQALIGGRLCLMILILFYIFSPLPNRITLLDIILNLSVEFKQYARLSASLMPRL